MHPVHLQGLHHQQVADQDLHHPEAAQEPHHHLGQLPGPLSCLEDLGLPVVAIIGAGTQRWLGVGIYLTKEAFEVVVEL